MACSNSAQPARRTRMEYCIWLPSEARPPPTGGWGQPCHRAHDGAGIQAAVQGHDQRDDDHRLGVDSQSVHRRHGDHRFSARTAHCGGQRAQLCRSHDRGYGDTIQDALNSAQTPTMANFGTLANVLAGCITRVIPDAVPRFLAAATPPTGVPPTDTLTAAESLARYPWFEPERIFALHKDQSLCCMRHLSREWWQMCSEG
jgi:hypothetical protein